MVVILGRSGWRTLLRKKWGTLARNTGVLSSEYLLKSKGFTRAAMADHKRLTKGSLIVIDDVVNLCTLVAKSCALLIVIVCALLFTDYNLLVMCVQEISLI